ncbi:type II secretion system protein N [Sphingomonas sp. MAH-20]|uniref:Type II secretion system protein N n=1 Tax=Sphingomonas horti TaxID=2682842 RepID=A0A6I4IW55_9SPHN|nr:MULTISPECIES: type II secretion system protein N [Sphingomonas]MBA2920127.1 type II secretion system protein N [Sphingomonas sp. CGMCC 1.13658]MVO76382.1 type II secretion system protein N [Sphingomonas horti]
MRVRLPMRRVVLFAALFVVALVVFLPLRLVLAGSGIAAREATGSIWSGTLREARIGPALIGDVGARVLPLPLLTGGLHLELSRPTAAADRLSGTLILSRNRRAIEGATGLIPLEVSLDALPATSVELTDVTLRFRDGQCDRAEGMVRANLAGGAGFPASVSAALRCDRGAALLPFVVAPAGARIELRIFGDGRWQVGTSRR